jgi:hypothetical protein
MDPQLFDATQTVFLTDAQSAVIQAAVSRAQARAPVQGVPEAASELPDAYKVSEKTAADWVHRLGYEVQTYQAGGYFDGHSRDDVVKDRGRYLREKLITDKTTLHQMPSEEEKARYLALPLLERPYVEFVQDESCFNANQDNSKGIAKIGEAAELKSKSKGAGLMESLIINELQGGVTDYEGELCVELMEYGKGNWWTSDRMIAWLRKCIEIRKKLFPWARVIWRFDHSSNHTAKAEDALNASRMNIGPGGKQPKMRDTVVQDEESKLFQQVQSMIHNGGPLDGQAKGLKTVMDERWGEEEAAQCVGTRRKTLLSQRLSKDWDFMLQSTLIHDLIAELCPGDLCSFYTKFHCEFPSVERTFSAQKAYCKAKCRYNLPGLRKLVPQCIDAVCADVVQRHFGLCRRYEAAYRLGLSNADISKAVRLTRYTSHRRVLDRTGIVAQLLELGIPESEFDGLCFCNKCRGCTCQGKCLCGRSICKQPRCSTHGDPNLPDDVVPRLGYLVAKKSKRGETTEYVLCEKGCRKWREVDKKWHKKLLNDKIEFSCSVATLSCDDQCGWCEKDICECDCDDCDEPMSLCQCDDSPEAAAEIAPPKSKKKKKKKQAKGKKSKKP